VFELHHVELRPRSLRSVIDDGRSVFARRRLTLVGLWSNFMCEQCPLRVTSRHMQCERACQLYPQKRTFVAGRRLVRRIKNGSTKLLLHQSCKDGRGNKLSPDLCSTKGDI